MTTRIVIMPRAIALMIISVVQFVIKKSKLFFNFGLFVLAPYQMLAQLAYR